MNKTKIEWVKNPDGSQGYTWNPITGCLNRTPEGLCLGGMFPCYAFRLANGRLFKRYTANNNYAPVYSDGKGISTDIVDTFDPFYPRFWPSRLEELHSRNRGLDRIGIGEPKGIFVCDMSDLFGIGIPEDWTNEVLNAIDMNEEHDRFYLLTKQPQNLSKFSPFPENCWVGVTATRSSMFEVATAYLAGIEASVKYVSIEPLLSWNMGPNCMAGYLEERGINWLILGSQTKPYRPPEIELVREIVSAADLAGTPIFLKDNLSRIAGDPRQNFNLYNHFEPMNPVLRQEMPK